MTALVTVVYEPELHMLELQAKSLATYLGRGFFTRIIVITNGCHPSTVDPSWYGKHAHMVHVINSRVLLPVDVGNGYVNQQALKLQVAHLIKDEWYVVLDAKNFLIREYAHECLFHNDKPLMSMHQHKLPSYGRRAMYYYAKLFGLSVISDLATQIHTPYVINAKRARVLPVEMLATHKPPSEFMWYYMYLKALGQLDAYKMTIREPALVIRGHTTRLIHLLEDCPRTWAGVHRTFYERANVSERDTLYRFLTSRVTGT